MKRRVQCGLRWVMFGLMLALVLASTTVFGAAGGTRTVKDMTGHTVTIPARVSRVAVGGALNQMVLMLGSPQKIVATATAVQSNPMFVKIYPQIKGVTAPFVIADANVEQLLATRPEVIFGGGDALRGLGIPVVEVSLRDPEEIKQAVRLVAEVLGPAEQKIAARFCREYDANIKRVTERTKGIPEAKRLKVYYAGNKALTSDGKNSITTSWIEMAGGINVAAEAGLDGVGRMVSLEDVIGWNPDVIIATGAATREEMLRNPQWKRIEAVVKHRVYLNPKGVYLWSVRSAEEALQTLWVAKALYPDLFTDLDLGREVKRFYEVYYKYRLSDLEVGEILEPKG